MIKELEKVVQMYEKGLFTIMVDNERGTKYVRCSTNLVGKSYHYDGGPYNAVLMILNILKNVLVVEEY